MGRAYSGHAALIEGSRFMVWFPKLKIDKTPYNDSADRLWDNMSWINSPSSAICNCTLVFCKAPPHN